MRTKLCEKCNQMEVEIISGNKKYCEGCRIIANREKVQRHANKFGMGIYKITNLINNKIYIGQSIQLNKRISEHKRELKNNSHYNNHLQRAYNKYGIENFSFEIIENCTEDELYPRENYWITFYNSQNSNSGYNNTLPLADEKKYRHKEESKAKMSNSKKVFESEELISYLQEYYYHYGKVPTSRDIVNAVGFPSNHIFFERYGSFKNALIEAGLYELSDNKSSFDRVEYTKDEVYLKFKVFIDKNGRFPNHKELKNSRANELPTSGVVLKHYKSTENLRKEFGFDKDSLNKIERKNMLSDLKTLYQKDGHVTSRTIDKSNITKSSSSYIAHFGTLENAYKLAEIPFVKYNQKF